MDERTNIAEVVVQTTLEQEAPLPLRALLRAAREDGNPLRCSFDLRTGVYAATFRDGPCRPGFTRRWLRGDGRA